MLSRMYRLMIRKIITLRLKIAEKIGVMRKSMERISLDIRLSDKKKHMNKGTNDSVRLKDIIQFEVYLTLQVTRLQDHRQTKNLCNVTKR